MDNRDLDSFAVDIQTTVNLLAAIPTGGNSSSRSQGIRTRAEIEELERVGVDAVLVAERLMQESRS